MSQDHCAPARHPAGRGSFPRHRPKTPQAPEQGHPAGPPRETGWCEGGARHPEVPLRLCHACLALCGVWGQEGGQCALLGVLHTQGLGSGTEAGLCFRESLPPSLESPSQGTESMTGQSRAQSKASGPRTGPVQTGGGTETSTDTSLESGLAVHADSCGCLGAGTCPPHSQTAGWGSEATRPAARGAVGGCGSHLL